MKLVFFGTSGAVQSAASGNVSFAVSGGPEPGGFTVLVEASGNPVQGLKAAGIDPIGEGSPGLGALAVTHIHPDHIYAAPVLMQNLWLMKRRRPLTVLVNAHTREWLADLLDRYSLLTREGMFEIHWQVLEEGDFQVAPGCTVRLFPVRHSVPTSGVTVSDGRSRLVYSSDTAPAETVLREATGAQALVHEASGGLQKEEELNPAGHSSARQAGQTASGAGVRRLFLCHFESDREADRAALLGEARSAFTGEVLIPELLRAYEV